MSSKWNDWIWSNWDELVAGKKIGVPHWLAHPNQAGFARESMATPAGPCADWVTSIDDESRIHVHEYSDGRLVAHRDRIDPNRDIFHALAHIFTETGIGRAAVFAMLVFGAVKAINSASS